MSLIRNSLRTHLVVSVFAGLAFIILSMTYVLGVTLRLQHIVNDQFQREISFQELQQQVVGSRQPLLDYLSSRSSQALAALLVEEQRLREMLPEDLPLTDDPLDIELRELFSHLETYIALIQEIIFLKRGRVIEQYTELYETMEELNEHISDQIDKISLFGLRRELANYEVVIATSRRLLFWNLLVITFAFLGSLFWILSVIQRVTEPMDRLAFMAGEISSGNFEGEDISVPAVREVAVVVKAFNTMKHDIRRYIAEINKQKQIEQGYLAEKLRNMKMEELLKRMELYTMQAQMNPHFLFNTLNTGVQLAITENAERTADYMEHLARFFRNNVRDRNLIIPLRQEVAGLDSYLYILRIRFGAVISFQVDIPDHLADCSRVPALILQPLVENSVIHAFKGISRQGLVAIRAREDGDILEISVEDNGVGIPPGVAEELLQRKPQDRDRRSRVMGLENVIQRLYFFYPNRQDVISLESVPEEGTAIRIRIDPREEPCIPS
ncbi:Histidine kinase-, DNA gyrase B-, and HSP90-like ATPase [Alkalispirochaeta americana]|uniref:Histidine kinase-, DNA gyrase B-, and HSP90-like ATPase n=1 Tax=Alkalispirochaeta americana TaxID=159291 RepID=A0A1N6SDM5_9SPIO|nr:histidine kinase [Alkalispirochaeta americana]SIQ39245.1 Histidine kinase-, DNA gyrase B-, and HSP90-like ATPase [Alkalispirochaeta americana]